MLLHVVRHALEGLGQHADLVIPVVVQREVVVALVRLDRSLGQLLQRPGKVPHEEVNQQARQYQHDRRGNQNPVDHLLPVTLRLVHRHGDIQPHPVRQFQPRCFLIHPVKGIVCERAFAHHAFRQHRFLVLCQLGQVNLRVIDQTALRIRQERIAVVVQLDALHLLCHRAVIDLNADHADKLPPVINRYIVGDHPYVVQALRQVRREPYGVPCILWHCKPYQLACILRIVLGYVRYLVFHKVFPVQIGEPEAFHVAAYFRIQAVIVGQYAVGLPGNLFKIILYPLRMGQQLFLLQPFQILFRVGRHFLHGLLNAVEVVVEIPFPRLAQQQEQLVTLPVLRVPDEQHARQRDDNHSNHRDDQGYQRNLRSQRAHYSSSFPAGCIFMITCSSNSAGASGFEK